MKFIKKYLTAAIAAAAAAALCITAIVLLSKRDFINSGFMPLCETMKAAGYTDCKNGTFTCTAGDIEINVSFDFENDICRKNSYSFDLDGKYFVHGSSYFVDCKLLESITNKRITARHGIVHAQDISYAPHQWTTEFEPVVAHSGGDIRGGTYTDYYTNSLEAVIQNYDLGFRVFEMDFYLTSDKQLAVVHDWEHYANYDGTAPAADEWKSMKTHGYPQKSGVYYTTMLAGDLLDQMMINRDMFVITDTKSFEISKEDTRLQFEILRDEAMKRDPRLLKRIIPQVYNEEMYDLIMDIYEFPDVIYTLYATVSTADRAAEFISDKENIKVITVRKTDERFLQYGLAKKLAPLGKLVYVHTLKYFNELADCAAYGAYGFYAHHLTPEDYRAYAKYK